MRQRAGKSVADLARTTRLSEAAIRKLESGRSREPGLSAGLEIARELGVSPYELADIPGPASASSDLLARALRALRDRRRELDGLGIARAAVFGSVARGAATAESDVDVLIELTPGAVLGLLQRARIARELSADLGRPVDVVRSDRFPEYVLSPHREAVYAY